LAQIGQVLQHQRRVLALPTDGGGGDSVNGAGKDSQTGEQPPHFRREELVAPVERRTEGLLTARQVTRAAGQEGQSLTQPG